MTRIDVGSSRTTSLARIESAVLSGGRNYLATEGFIEVQVPHLTKATGSCENFMSVFELDYFGEQMYLTQTGQLYLEVLTPTLKKVWTLIHSFRAEPDIDTRHLTEFPLFEIEFEGDYDDLIDHIEQLIFNMALSAFGIGTKELDYDHLDCYIPPYSHITYDTAIDMLDLEWGQDIKSTHEKRILEDIGMKPFFLTHWPTELKFFDMKTDPDRPEIVKSCDLILPYAGEAVGGAEREHTYEALKTKLDNSIMLDLLIQRGGSPEDFDWFMDFYKTHTVNPHSGCGIGIPRVIQSILKAPDIRECTVFPINRELYW